MSGNSAETTLENIEGLLTQIRDDDRLASVLDQMRSDNRDFAEQLLKAISEQASAIEDVKYEIGRVASGIEEAARSLSALEDHFMPPRYDDDP